MENFAKIERLGTGAYGAVIKARVRSTGEYVILKKMPSFAKEVAKNEVRILKLFEKDCFPYIVCLQETIISDTFIYLVFRYLENTYEMQSFISNNGIQDISVNYMIALTSIIGLMKIHETNVVHRDIKPPNMIVNPNTQMVTYIDFGGSCTIDDQSEFIDFVGSPGYLDPQFINTIIQDEEKQPISVPVTFERLKAVDVWALGCVLFYVYTGKSIDSILFPDIDNVENLKKAVSTITQEQIDRTLQSHIKDESSKFVSELIWPMLRINWKERIELENTLERLYIMADFLTGRNIPIDQKLNMIVERAKAKALKHVDKNTKKF